MNILIFNTETQRAIKNSKIIYFYINFILLCQLFKFKVLFFKKQAITT